MAINILVIDDEPVVADYLADCIHRQYPDTSILKYTESEKLLSDIKSMPLPQMAFVDIQMPGTNGIELGTYLQTQFPAIKMIFISGHPEYVSDIFFSTQPYGFLEKPFQEEKICRYIDRIIMDENDDIQLGQGDKSLRIKTNNILWMESNRKNIRIMTSDGICTVTGKLSEILLLLPSCFVRCHQSFVVNVKYVTKCDMKDFTMIDGTMISISRTYKESSLNKYYAFRGNLL